VTAGGTRGGACYIVRHPDNDSLANIGNLDTLSILAAQRCWKPAATNGAWTTGHAHKTDPSQFDYQAAGTPIQMSLYCNAVTVQAPTVAQAQTYEYELVTNFEVIGNQTSGGVSTSTPGATQTTPHTAARIVDDHFVAVHTRVPESCGESEPPSSVSEVIASGAALCKSVEDTVSAASKAIGQAGPALSRVAGFIGL